MDKYSSNLRFFFGPEASTVWSLRRHRNRALRSIELYELVIQHLAADLNIEQTKRGTLVRLRSNEVTDVKDKIAKKSEARLKISHELNTNQEKIDTLPERILVRIYSLFSSSESLDGINEEIVKQKKKLKILDREIYKLGESLSKAVYKQNAAQDPIDDLEFAIEHLNGEIEKCRQTVLEVEEGIGVFIARECLEGGPLHLECMLANGLQPADKETFCSLYLKIFDQVFDLVNCLPTSHEAESCDFEEVILSGFGFNTINARANVSMSGRGSHHRRVRRGKRRVWREFDVKFSGRVNTSFDFKQRRWDKSAAAKAMQATASEKFHQGRNLKLAEYRKEFEATRKSLLESASTLFALL